MMLQLKTLISTPTKWLEKQQNTILSAAMVITVSNVLSQVSGLLRDRLLIYNFFTTEALQQAFEAYKVAFQIPDMMFQLIILGAVSGAYIPVFSQLRKNHSTKKAFEMTSVAMTILLIVFVLVGLVVGYFAIPITQVRTGAGFTYDQILITANLTRIMLVAQLFFAVSNFLTGSLQAFQRFMVPAIAPLLYNLGIVLGVFVLSGQLGIYSAGVGVVFGAFLHMLIQLPQAIKLGFKLKPSLNFKTPGLKRFFILMPPRVMALSVTEIQNLLLGFFTTSLGNLSYVILTLALQLMKLPIRLFGIPISQASLPFLSNESSKKNMDRFSDLLTRSLNQIAFFAYPASVLLLILRVPFVRIIYGTKNFPWETTLAVGRVVAILALSIGAQAMVHLIIRAFHALQDTKTPFFITLFSAVMYLGGSWFFVFNTDLGVLGIGLSIAMAALLELALALILLHRKVPILNNTTLWLAHTKIIVASFFMAVFLYLPYRIFDELIFNTTRTVELIGLTITTGTIGMLVYIYFCALLDVHELDLVKRISSNFGGWQKPLASSKEVLVETSIEGDEI